MSTSENRAKYNRDKLHYPSDLTDEEWSYVAPLIPPAKHGGRKRKVDVREVVNGIMPGTGQGLRKPHPQCLGILASRLDPTHAQKTL